MAQNLLVGGLIKGGGRLRCGSNRDGRDIAEYEGHFSDTGQTTGRRTLYWFSGVLT